MENSKIGWTDDTWNLWTGCTHAQHFDGSPRPACGRCYAEAWAKRTGGITRPPLCEWGDDKPRHKTADSIWQLPYKWNRKAKEAGRRRNVFVNSPSDFFDIADSRTHEWRAEALMIMGECQYLNFLLLTKRIDLAPHCLSKTLPMDFGGKLKKNIWLGITVENQKAFDEQWPIHKHIGRIYQPGQLFFSMEPLFEHVNIRPALSFQSSDRQEMKLGWAIVGGESGNGCAETKVEDLITIASQCSLHEIPVFVKQLGARPTLAGCKVPIGDTKGENPIDFPHPLNNYPRQFPEGAFEL